MQHTPTTTPTPSGGKSQKQAPSTQVSIYSPNFTCMVTVPRSTISHMPAQRLNITRLVACKNFSEAVEESGQAHLNDVQWCLSACKMGNRCKFVHVSRPLSEFPSQALHAHYIWRSEEDVTYDRLIVTEPIDDTPTLRLVHRDECRERLSQYRQQASSPQEDRTVVHVLGGDVELHDRTEPGVPVMIDVIAAVMPSVRVPATRLLKTEGAVECLSLAHAGQPVPVLTICASYSCENECRHGSKCRDAHVINIDSTLTAPFVRRSIRNVKDAASAIKIRKAPHLGLFPVFHNSPTVANSHPSFNDQSVSQQYGVSGGSHSHPSLTTDLHSSNSTSSRRYCNDPYLSKYQKELQEHGTVTMSSCSINPQKPQSAPVVL